MCQQLGTRLAVLDSPDEMKGLRDWSVKGLSDNCILDKNGKCMDRVSTYLINDMIRCRYDKSIYFILLLDSQFL